MKSYRNKLPLFQLKGIRDILRQNILIPNIYSIHTKQVSLFKVRRHFMQSKHRSIFDSLFLYLCIYIFYLNKQLHNAILAK